MAPKRVRTCEICGGQWCNINGGTSRKICPTVECRRLHLRNKQRKRRRRVARERAEVVACKRCGVTWCWLGWRKNTSAKYCSDACYRAVRNAKNRRREARERRAARPLTCERCGSTWCRLPGIAKAVQYRYCTPECHAAARRERERRRHLDLRPHQTCAVCGVMWSNFNSQRYRYCSDACKQEAIYRAKAPRVFACQRCGSKWCRLPGLTGGTLLRYCSPECADAVLRIRRRRRTAERQTQLTGIIDPLEVFERDRWVCGICRRSVNKNLPGMHPNGPTVDHIVPLSLGGKDEMRNVQLAHRRCNLHKGNRAVGSQLRLVG